MAVFWACILIAKELEEGNEVPPGSLIYMIDIY